LISTVANALGVLSHDTQLEQKPSMIDSILELLVMDIKIPKKFSKDRLIIENLYKDDDTFREIYQDYQTYLNALQLWEQSSSDEAAARRSEYSELVGELEEEVTEILNKNES
jgi:hypothetical protein